MKYAMYAATLVLTAILANVQQPTPSVPQTTASDAYERVCELFRLAFGCHHRTLSRVFTLEGRTYRVCYVGGAYFDYCLQTMFQLAVDRASAVLGPGCSSPKKGDQIKGVTMLSLTIHNLGEVTLVRCAGRITADSGNILRDGVVGHVHGPTAVLDLGEVSAVDAAGLGMFLLVRGWAHATGRELKLLNLSPRLEKLLDLTKLRSVFEVCSATDMFDLLCRLRYQLPMPTGAATSIYFAAPALSDELQNSLEDLDTSSDAKLRL